MNTQVPILRCGRTVVKHYHEYVTMLIDGRAIGVMDYDKFPVTREEYCSFAPNSYGKELGLTQMDVRTGVWDLIVAIAKAAKAAYVEKDGSVSYDESHSVGYQLAIVGLPQAYAQFNSVDSGVSVTAAAPRNVIYPWRRAEAAARVVRKKLGVKIRVEPASKFWGKEDAIQPVYDFKLGERVSLTERLTKACLVTVAERDREKIAAIVKTGCVTAEIVGVRAAYGCFDGINGQLHLRGLASCSSGITWNYDVLLRFPYASDGGESHPCIVICSNIYVGDLLEAKVEKRSRLEELAQAL